MTEETARKIKYLVACEQCDRQYDVKDLAAKSKFHCSCGTVIEVPRFRPHAAAVVRCGSCGAARNADADSCKFCGADYTLHERDLQTICPKCMTRVSAKARYCHHCATPIVPAGDAGKATDRRCPVCGIKKTLRSRKFGPKGVTLLECSDCAGIWLDQEAFELLADKAREEALPEATSRASAAADPSRAQRGPLYRRCPRCREVMNRRNFGRRSGVIVDLCSDHGTWFDAHELDAALRWIKSGGETHAARREQEEAGHADRLKRLKAGLEDRSGAGAGSGTHGGGVSGGGGEMLVELFGALFDL